MHSFAVLVQLTLILNNAPPSLRDRMYNTVKILDGYSDLKFPYAHPSHHPELDIRQMTSIFKIFKMYAQSVLLVQITPPWRSKMQGANCFCGKLTPNHR
jgi:hypothetical protein